ncbi:MAG: DUF2255 family protein [bacterium]|nr:DUF2255 family protein [Gammaproteobacteria bacterium]HIL97990.1 DUF2255 family protein [Pseudomonadales bacterium]
MKIVRLSWCVFLLLMSLACQPRDVQPGLWLSGDEVNQQIDDWGFTDEIEEIYVETKPWYGIPHSTTIWCVVFAGELYIGSYGVEKKAWENNLAQDPEARLGISGKLYKVAVSRVTDKEIAENLNIAYNRKYDMEEVFGNEVPEWWFYLVEQQK